MSIRMGSRNRCLVLEEPDPEARDQETGQPLPPGHPNAWKKVREFFGSVEPLRGRQYWEAAQAQTDLTHTIRTYWFDGVKPSMRIRDGGQVYDKLVPRNLKQENRVLEILARERLE